MYKGAARAQQLHTRTGSEATRPSAKGFSLLGGGESPLVHLTPEQQRASLVAVVKGLESDLAQAKLSNDRRRIRMLGPQIQEMHKAISELRPKLRSVDRASIPHLFVDAAREILTKAQFDAVMTEANRRQRAGAAPAHPGEGEKNGRA